MNTSPIISQFERSVGGKLARLYEQCLGRIGPGKGWVASSTATISVLSWPSRNTFCCCGLLMTGGMVLGNGARHQGMVVTCNVIFQSQGILGVMMCSVLYIVYMCMYIYIYTYHIIVSQCFWSVSIIFEVYLSPGVKSCKFAWPFKGCIQPSDIV